MRSSSKTKQKFFDEYFERTTLSQRRRNIRKIVFLVTSTGGTFGYINFVEVCHSTKRDKLYDELSESETYLLTSLLNLVDSYQSPFVNNNPCGIPKAHFGSDVHLSLIASFLCFTSLLTFIGRVHRRASIKFWSDLVTKKKSSFVQIYTNRLNGEVLFVSAPERLVVSSCLENGMDVHQTKIWLNQFIRDSERYLQPWWKEFPKDILWALACSSPILLAMYSSAKESKADHEPKMIATLTLLLSMEEVVLVFEERIHVLEKVFKTSNIKSILTRDNIHLITTYIFDDLGCYASQSFLDRLSRTINQKPSSRYRIENEDDTYQDFYRSHVLYKLLGRLDLITWDLSRSSVGFNQNCISPNILTVLQR